MAGKKISELQALTEITGQEMIPVARDGQNYSVLSSLLQSGGATKLNDYMYDVSELMGKMAVRGIKGSATFDKGNSGAYNVDGTIGASGYLHNIYYVKPGFVYYFNVSFRYVLPQDTAFLVLFDKDGKVLKGVPANEEKLFQGYFVFTSEVYKYGVTYSTFPGTSYDFGDEYEIQDINDVLSGINTNIETNTASINSYKTEISEVLVRSTIRDGKSTDLKKLISDAVFDMNGNLISKAGGYYQTIIVDLSKVYYLKVEGAKGDNSSLCLFDHNDKLIISTNEAVDGSFIFAGVAKIGISCNTESDANSMVINSFDTQDLTTVLNTSQGNRALYVAAGAVYNEQTGFYELNGLTDITEEQMRNIYVKTNPSISLNDKTACFTNLGIRTNLRFVEQSGYKSEDIQAIFSGCNKLEVAFLAREDINFYGSRYSYAFRLCNSLKTILGNIVFPSGQVGVVDMFKGCNSLVTVKIRSLNTGISFSDSPLLSLESLQYLITNAANTSAITVTVHADVYAKIQDETQADWHALVASAQEKNITFATA